MSDFTAEVATICEEQRDTVGASTQDMEAEQLEAYAQETLIPQLQTQFDRLRDVNAPEEVADRFQAYLDEGERVLGQIEEDASVLNDPENFTRLNEEADAAGLPEACRIDPG